MEIKYLNKLADNPLENPQSTDGRTYPIRPLPMSDIIEMEQLYNGGNAFPAALRELLFLAGDDCYVFDYGSKFNAKTMQEYVRRRLAEHGKSIPRPFIAIDFSNQMGEYFGFVYLDEGDDPPVYAAYYYDEDLSEDEHWIQQVSSTLSGRINRSIDRNLAGDNIF